MIFFRKGTKTNAKGDKVPYDFEGRINQAVFPGLQGKRIDFIFFYCLLMTLDFHVRFKIEMSLATSKRTMPGSF